MKLKFLTLNTWLGGQLLDKMLNFLKEENADIVTLQEVYLGTNQTWDKQFRSLEILKKELAYSYSAIAPHVQDKRSFGTVEQANVILSKFPILTENVTFFDVPFQEKSEETETDWSNWPCNLQHAKIEVDGKGINVFNTHGPWGVDGKDNGRRLKMSQVIQEQVKDKEYAILAGDFNVQPNTKTIENIESYLINVFKNELKSTFNMKRKTNPGYATAVVDMIFVTENITVINKSCPEVDVSDHLPLICTFEV